MAKGPRLPVKGKKRRIRKEHALTEKQVLFLVMASFQPYGWVVAFGGSQIRMADQLCQHGYLKPSVTQTDIGKRYVLTSEGKRAVE